MSILHALPLVLACTMAVPAVFAQSNDKFFYNPPQMMDQKLSITSSTANSVSFSYKVKSLIGKASNVSLSIKVIGNPDIVAEPDNLNIESLEEGKSQELNFVLPITPAQAADSELKIQGRVDYSPDYDAIIKAIEADVAYPVEVAKEELIEKMKRAKEDQSNSSEAIRYIPEKK